jgi:hypothetical protein
MSTVERARAKLTVGRKEVKQMEYPIVVRLCNKFVERENALGMKKGKGRDDAAMHYFVGAAQALPDGSEDQRHVIAFLTFGLQCRGYQAIADTLKDSVAQTVAAQEVTR